MQMFLATFVIQIMKELLTHQGAPESFIENGVIKELLHLGRKTKFVLVLVLSLQNRSQICSDAQNQNCQKWSTSDNFWY